MIFDCHADVLVDVTDKRMKGEKQVFKKDYYERYKTGKIDSGIFVLWTDPTDSMENDNNRFKDLAREGLAEIEENQDIIKKVLNFEDFQKAREEGKIAMLVGIEGLGHLGEDIDRLDYYYNELGIRHASLTWNDENPLATGARGTLERGLTEKGKEAVRKMEELGMIVDVSHLNDKSFWDLLEVATKPVIASHSNARALSNVPRNLTDEQLIALAKTGGVVGINSTRRFVSTDESKQNVNTLIDHLDYMVKLIGIDHVGFGFDFCDMFDDDTNYDPNVFHARDYDMYSIDGMPLFIKELDKRGYSQEEIEKLYYKNFMRVFKEILK